MENNYISIINQFYGNFIKNVCVFSSHYTNHIGPIIIFIFFSFLRILNGKNNKSESLINNSKFYIDSNDSDYITNSTYYKNYNENIIMNRVNFEDIFSFERNLVNKLKFKHESSVLLKRNISNNEIIIYNIINSKEYNEKLINILISILSDKEFGIYVKLHNNYNGISNFKYLFYFCLIISISNFFGIKMKISFDERISKLKHIVF